MDYRRSASGNFNDQFSIINSRAARPGYVFLITVLLVGGIATAVVTSLLFIAVNSGRSALTLQQSSAAYSYAMSCAEIALRNLRIDGAYAGNETVAMPLGNCHIYAVGGSGNEDRVICTEGTSGTVERRMEVEINVIIPSILLKSWREVPAIELCPTS